MAAKAPRNPLVQKRNPVSTAYYEEQNREQKKRIEEANEWRKKQDGIIQASLPNRAVKKPKTHITPKTHIITDDDDINEFIKKDKVNVGDIIQYNPPNQEGIIIYEVIAGLNGSKSYNIISDYNGLYSDASNASAAQPGGGRRRTRHKNRRTKRRHNKKRHTKRRR
jgi:hypothetical protein